MNPIKASIIVPCYKAEQYLPRCLESLMNQTLDEIEVICINDGSPDSSLEIIKTYHSRYGDKIMVIDKDNDGAWNARLDGIKVAQGEYIGFVDSDDYVKPNFVEELYNAASREDADIAVCGFSRIDSHTNKILSREMCAPRASFVISDDPGKLIEINSAQWNKFYRSELVKEIVALENPPAVLEDLFFNLLVYNDASKRIVFVPDALVNYMVHSDSAINSIETQELMKGFLSFLDVKEIYLDSNASNKMLEALDTIAFLHLGISMMYRLSNDPSIDIDKAISQTTAYLDTYFPLWRRSRYLTLSYSLEAKGSFLKLYPASKVYELGLMRPFLKLYQTLLSKANIDIKW